MLVVPAAEIDRTLTYPGLIAALRDGFREGVVTPLRHHHKLPQGDGGERTLLLMPAWSAPAVGKAGHVGVKVITVYPENRERGGETVQGAYLLFAAEDGMPLATMDGPALTLWRTAAASALAAGYLARPDAERLVMIGAGALAPHMVLAHASVRPIRNLTLWNRTRERAEALAQRLAGQSFDVAVADDLEKAVRNADIVCSATSSPQPLVRGQWLKEGAHVDLVGAFRPDLRECDDETMRRAQIFVDTRDGALSEAGDIVQAVAAKAIAPANIRADLAELCRGQHPGRRDETDITLFKSVGTALEDLVAAEYVYARMKQVD